MHDDSSLQRRAAEAGLGHVQPDGQLWAAITTAEQAVLYANAQNLVGRWNNIITAAGSGEEQLAWMRASGVFADDIALTFVMHDGPIRGFTLFELTYDPARYGREAPFDPVRYPRAIQFIQGALADGRLRPVIHRVFPFERIVEAHRYVESGAQTGKVVVSVP